MTNPRVTAAMKKAALQSIADSIANGTVDVEALCLAVITADDHTTRYCVGTRDPHGHTTIYGPYATAAAARKALESGACAHSEGTRGDIYPLVPSPKAPRARRKKGEQ